MKSNIYNILILLFLLILTGCDKKDDNNPLPGNVIGIIIPEMNANKPYIRSQEAIIGNFVCDAYMEYAEYKGYEADLSACNSGNIRFDPEIHPNGIYPANLNVDTAIIYEIFPWEDGLVLVDITGAELLSTFERSVAALPSTTGSYIGCFLQVSHEVKVEYNLSNPAQIIDNTNPDIPVIASEGHRVVSLKINDVEVDSNQTYHFIVPTWMADGGDDYLTMKGIDTSRKHQIGDPSVPPNPEREALIYYLHKYESIAPEIEERITFSSK